LLDSAGVQAFACVVGVDSDCFNGSRRGYINKGHSVEVENNGSVVVSSHALTNMVSHVCSGTKTQRTAKVEQSEVIVNGLKDLGFCFSQYDLATITLTANSSQLFVRNLLNEGQGCNDHTRHDRRDEIDEDSEAQYQCHQHEIKARSLMRTLQVGNVDNVVANLDQNPG